MRHLYGIWSRNPLAVEAPNWLEHRVADFSPERLLEEFNELLREMPDDRTLHEGTGASAQWLGRAGALMHAWDPVRAAALMPSAQNLKSGSWAITRMTLNGIHVAVHQARADLMLRTSTPLSVAIQAGNVFDYFDEVRKVIELATEDLLFVDPYLDAEFAKRYLPHVRQGVVLRLLRAYSSRPVARHVIRPQVRCSIAR